MEIFVQPQDIDRGCTSKTWRPITETKPRETPGEPPVEIAENEKLEQLPAEEPPPETKSTTKPKRITSHPFQAGNPTLSKHCGTQSALLPAITIANSKKLKSYYLINAGDK